MDLCLVVPAFDAISFPPLGAAVIAAACRARGVSVGVVFGSMRLAARLGYDAYHAICNVSVREQSGEYLFLPHAYSADDLKSVPPGPVRKKKRALFDAAAAAIGPHLEEVVAAIAARRPRIVGISSNFQQNMAAFAIARRVRERLPDTVIVMGGANVAFPMGAGLAQVFPFVDHFFAGEADIAFPDFCEAFLRDGRRPADRVIRCAPVEDMAVVAPADFRDYVGALRALQAAGALPGTLPDFLTLETSRGCWWGEKHHCTFCGLNGETMGFRNKGAARVVAEIAALDGVWRGKRIHVADNIMPMSFFADVLPQLTALTPRPALFYEVKANLKDEQLDAMQRAGIYAIQPGIESLSTPVLRLMRKGISGLQNVALLRACAGRGMMVGWNYLYGFPGEAVADYDSVLALLPLLEHLQPPATCARIMIDRFSPYHDDAADFGIGALEPFPSYRGLYPAGAPLTDIAYHFNGRYSTPFLADRDRVAALRAAIARWQAAWADMARRPFLRVVDTGAARIAVTDTRATARHKLVALPREADAALRHFERPKPPAGLPDAVAAHVDELLERGFVVAHEGVLLSVVTRPPVMARTAAAAPRVLAAAR